MITSATVAVAIFAALIALGQWWTARQKLVLDLFEKSFQIFLDLRNIASEAIQFGKVSRKGLINEVVARSQFLFGDDINEPLKKMYSLIGELEAGRITAAMEIDTHFEKMLPLFRPYLTMLSEATDIARSNLIAPPKPKRPYTDRNYCTFGWPTLACPDRLTRGSPGKNGLGSKGIFDAFHCCDIDLHPQHPGLRQRGRLRCQRSDRSQ